MIDNREERQKLVKELLKTTLKDKYDWRGLVIKQAVVHLIEGLLSNDKNFTKYHYKEAMCNIKLLLGEVENNG